MTKILPHYSGGRERQKEAIKKVGWTKIFTESF